MKGPDGTPILIESIVRPPVVLDFTDSGRVILEFPTQHPTSTHDPICTSLVDGTYTITFPPSSVLTIPSGNIEPTVNGQRIQLSQSVGVIVNLPRGGSVSIPTAQTEGVVPPHRIAVLGLSARVTASTPLFSPYDDHPRL